MEPSSKRVKYQCGKCQQFFNRAERLQNHQKHCDVCNETFCGVKEYNKHQRALHLVGVNKCERCCRIFPSRKDLSLHQQSTVFHDCQVCDKKFCSAKDFNNHQLTEHDTDVKKCIRCLKTFSSSFDCERHQQNSIDHDCDFCEKKFCNERDYGLHQISVHHVNPRKCKICSKEYKTIRALRKHRIDAEPEQCDECNLVFCHKRDMNLHKMTTHTGGGCEADTELTNIFEQPICSATGFEKDSDYLEVINEHERIIKDHVKEKKNIYANINKEITPQFTYKDLHELVKNEVHKRGKVCRINIGFGIMLKNKLTNAYRYYYVSTNHLLFKQAFTISTRDDINKFIKELYDINVCETSYLTRPDSSWVVAGLPNVLIKLSLLNVVFG